VQSRSTFTTFHSVVLGCCRRPSSFWKWNITQSHVSDSLPVLPLCFCVYVRVYCTFCRLRSVVTIPILHQIRSFSAFCVSCTFLHSTNSAFTSAAFTTVTFSVMIWLHARSLPATIFCLHVSTTCRTHRLRRRPFSLRYVPLRRLRYTVWIPIAHRFRVHRLFVVTGRLCYLLFSTCLHTFVSVLETVCYRAYTLFLCCVSADTAFCVAHCCLDCAVFLRSFCVHSGFCVTFSAVHRFAHLLVYTFTATVLLDTP